MTRLFLLLAILGLFISTCSPSIDMARSNLPRDDNPQISVANLTALAVKNNTFGLELYLSLSETEGNIVISPYILSSAFAMTYAGARGDTASQIASTFHFELPEDQLHTAFNALDLFLAKQTNVEPIRRDQDPPQLDIINTIWAQEGLPFEAPFLDTLSSNYDAGIHLVDFKAQPGETRNLINDFVSRKTNNEVLDLFPEGAINQETRLILVNTINFEADWDEFFTSANDLPFYLLNGSAVNVPAMQIKERRFPYAEGEHWQAIQLPYLGETFVMLLIAPKKDEFKALEATMDYQFASDVISSLQTRSVDLMMPKFEFTNHFAF